MRTTAGGPPPFPVRGTVAGFEAAAAGALAGLTLLAAPGTRGLLGGDRSLLPVMAAGLVMHLLAWVCRRRLGSVGFLVALAATVPLVGWLALPGTTVAGLPWTDTWSAAGAGMREVLEALSTGAPPGTDEPEVLRQGRMVLAVLSAAVVALMADQAAFHVRRAALALLPSFSLVLLGATRAPADQPGRTVAAYLGMAMVFLLLHHTMATRAVSVSVGGRSPFRLASLAPAGACLAAAVVAALVVGPRLPGYGEPPIVAEAGSVLARQGPGVRLSSFVDLNPVLTERSDLVMFTVASPVAAYWRLTALDRFDGRTWSRGPDDERNGSELDAGYLRGTEAVQSFQIENLRSEWLPAAYRPQRVDGPGDYLVTGASATVRQREETRSGQRYQVASLIPRLAAFQLERLQVPSSGPALRRYLALPPDLPRRVVAEARRVAGSAPSPSPYATALALQDYFRNGRFTYDLGARPGSGKDALVRFLFQTRRGYCEQFAGAFAAMARAAGLPARVAVGFTHGELGDDGRYQVRALNAHAWPEIYLGGAGWVAFEPTPGRGMPGAEGYTGVAAAQAELPRADVTIPTAGTTPLPTPVVPTTDTTAATPTTSTGPTVPGASAPSSVPGRQPVPSGKGTGGVPLIPISAGSLVLLAAAGVPLVKRRRRRARRRRAVGPNDRVLVAWAEAAEALAEWGMARRCSETLLDHAARAADDPRLPERVAEPVLMLAGRAGTASYSGREVGAEEAADSHMAAATIEDALRRATPLHRRLGRALAPWHLWKRRPL